MTFHHVLENRRPHPDIHRDMRIQNFAYWLDEKRDSHRGDPEAIGRRLKKARVSIYCMDIRGLPEGNLLGMPWRVALAMQSDGWLLRQEIIWERPNSKPESVRSRPVRSHETVFMLAKQMGHYYGFQDCLEPAVKIPGTMRSLRSVWSVPTQRLAEKHLAPMPLRLAVRCVLAGCPRGGLVLDPFAGAGTSVLAAATQGRRAVGVEINDEYAQMAAARVKKAGYPAVAVREDELADDAAAGGEGRIA